MDQQKNIGGIIIAIVLTAVIIGGGVYLWQKNQREKDMRESAESLNKQLQSQLTDLQGQANQPKEDAVTPVNNNLISSGGEDEEIIEDDPYAGWETYTNSHYGFKVKHPPKYKTVMDNYGWPNALVHFIEKSGAQSYRAEIEAWDNKNDFKDTYSTSPPFITQAGGKYITINYAAASDEDDVREEWEIGRAHV